MKPSEADRVIGPIDHQIALTEVSVGVIEYFTLLSVPQLQVVMRLFSGPVAV